MTYKERLKELNLPTLRFRRIRGDMIETYKIIHGIYDKEIVQNLKLQTEIRKCGNLRGRHNLCLFQKRARLEMTSNSFTHRVAKVWNSIPEYVVNSTSVIAFKNNLDKAWEEKEAVYNFRVGILEEEEDDQ